MDFLTRLTGAEINAPGSVTVSIAMQRFDGAGNLQEPARRGRGVAIAAGFGEFHALVPTSLLGAQSSARTPKPVSLGIPSRISAKPRSISAARLFSLTGDDFVRLALISRIAQRRRIAVSRSSPASNDFACSARLTALSASVGGATGSTLFGWLEKAAGAGSSSKKVGGEGSVLVEIRGGSLNICASSD